jgi:hypothetical protein
MLHSDLRSPRRTRACAQVSRDYPPVCRLPSPDPPQAEQPAYRSAPLEWIVGATIHVPSTSKSLFQSQDSSIAVGPAFLRYESASPPAPARSRKTHVAHRRIKIERVYRPYLTATEAAVKRRSDLSNKDAAHYAATVTTPCPST